MNQPRKPFQGPGTPGEDVIEEGLQSAGKAVRGVWDFLTSPDNKEFLRKVDERHGTQLGELYQKFKEGPGAAGGDELSPDALPEKGEVVIVVQEDEPEPEKPCTFCNGKQVIALKGATRTPIACPACKKNPSAKAKALPR